MRWQRGTTWWVGLLCLCCAKQSMDGKVAAADRSQMQRKGEVPTDVDSGRSRPPGHLGRLVVAAAAFGPHGPARASQTMRSIFGTWRPNRARWISNPYMVRIGINGLGRIGRMALRAARLRSDVQVVAVNDLVPVDYLAHSVKHDSVHGRLPESVGVRGSELLIGAHTIAVHSERDPANIPWRASNVDVVLEATGAFLSRERVRACSKPCANGCRNGCTMMCVIRCAKSARDSRRRAG